MARAILAVKVNPIADQQYDLEHFLSFSPNADDIRRLIFTPPSHQYFYHPATCEATYVTTSGLNLVCIRVPDITEVQAEEIYHRLMVPRVDTSAWMSLPLFERLASSVTGESRPAIWYTRP